MSDVKLCYTCGQSAPLRCVKCEINICAECQDGHTSIIVPFHAGMEQQPAKTFPSGWPAQNQAPAEAQERFFMRRKPTSPDDDGDGG